MAVSLSVESDGFLIYSSEMAFSSKLELKRFPDVSVSYPSRKDFASLESCEIYSYDTDKNKNLRVVSKIANATQFKAIQFNGFTSFLHFKYRFPIYCSRREFISFLINVKNHEDRRTLFEEGILTTSMYNDFPYVWRNMFGNATKLAALGVFANYQDFACKFASVGSFLFWMFYGLSGYDQSFIASVLLMCAVVNSNTSFINLYQMGGLFEDWSMLVIVFTEEYVKRYVPVMSWNYGLGFALFELVHKFLLFSSIQGYKRTFYMLPVMLLPFLMHPCAGSMHYLNGSMLHYVWNLYVSKMIEWFCGYMIKTFGNEDPVYRESLIEEDLKSCYYRHQAKFHKVLSDILIVRHRRAHNLPLVDAVFDDYGWNIRPLIGDRESLINATQKIINQKA